MFIIRWAKWLSILIIFVVFISLIGSFICTVTWSGFGLHGYLYAGAFVVRDGLLSSDGAWIETVLHPPAFLWIPDSGSGEKCRISLWLLLNLLLPLVWMMWTADSCLRRPESPRSAVSEKLFSSIRVAHSAKWVCSIGCLLCIGAMLMTVWWRLPVLQIKPNVVEYDLLLTSGCVKIIQHEWPQKFVSGPADPWVWLPELVMDTQVGSPNDWIVLVPVWMLLAPMMVGAWTYWRLSKRRLAGQCLTCGYNLTGNASGTCPECGSIVVEA